MSASNQQLIQQLQHEVSMLRDYSKALQAQNSTRNEQRKILQSQIQRLSNLQRQGQFRSVTTSIQACQECPKLKSQIMKLQNQVQRLTRQNTNLQQSYNVVSQSLSKYSTMDSSVNRTTVIRSSTVSNNVINKIGDDIQKKYKQLTEKYDTINYQNLQLKKDMQKWKKINIPNLQQKIKKLQNQNSGFNSKIYTLQNQIRNLKSTLTIKQNQISSLKNKPITTTVLTTNTNTSLLQNQIKTLKSTITDKDKQLIKLKTNENIIKSLQFQLKSYQSTILSKDSQILKLKQQISKSTNQSSKIYQLQSQIRNLKYTITNKDTEIQTLKNKNTQISSNQYNKISALQLQLKNIKIQLNNKDTQINSLKLKNTQTQTLKNKLSSQQNEIQNLKTKLSQPQPQPQTQQNSNLSNTLSHYTQQLTSQSIQISKLTSQINDKDIYIKRIQDQLKQLIKRDQQKNIQVHKLDNIVNSYVQKIGELQIQLNRLQKNSLNGSQNNGTATFINTSINNNQLIILTQQNKVLNQKIYDLQRRIIILQQTNISLREQLKLSIEMRSREASRIIMGSQSPSNSRNIIGNQQQQFMTTIQLLSKQNQGIKQINNKLKADNQYLQAKLSSSQLEIQNLVHFHKNKGIIQIPNIPINTINTKYSSTNLNTNTNKLLGNMPVIQTSKSSNYPKQVRIQHTYTVLDDSQRDPMTSMLTKNYQLRDRPRDRERDRKQSQSYRKDNMQIKSRDNTSKLRQRERERSDRIIQQNIGKISLSNINSNTTPNINMSNNINENQRKSQTNISNISGYRNSMGNISNVNNGSYDDLQKKIQMLKQQNKGLRKHLYQPTQ